MKIGIIGLSENVKEMLGDSARLSILGYYVTDSSSADSEYIESLEEYSSARELTEQSDILYINEDPNAFEIAKDAIKASTHLFLESPFLFSENMFNDLFELARENNVLLRFNQKILQKEIYKKISSNKEPGLLKFRVEQPENNDVKTLQKQVIFEFSSLIRDNINSGIRKINLSKDKQYGRYFSLTIQMDNDCGCELLFNTIAQEKQINLELFYPNKLLFIDFTNDKMISRNHKDNKTKKAEQKRNLMTKELDDFKTNLSKLKSMPITIREENQYLLYVANRLSEKLFQS